MANLGIYNLRIIAMSFVSNPKLVIEEDLLWKMYINQEGYRERFQEHNGIQGNRMRFH
jgi:hypothetical protein